jgi:hypothetical protein
MNRETIYEMLAMGSIGLFVFVTMFWCYLLVNPY